MEASLLWSESAATMLLLVPRPFWTAALSISTFLWLASLCIVLFWRNGRPLQEPSHYRKFFSWIFGGIATIEVYMYLFMDCLSKRIHLLWLRRTCSMALNTNVGTSSTLHNEGGRAEELLNSAFSGIYGQAISSCWLPSSGITIRGHSEWNHWHPLEWVYVPLFVLSPYEFVVSVSTLAGGRSESFPSVCPRGFYFAFVRPLSEIRQLGLCFWTQDVFWIRTRGRKCQVSASPSPDVVWRHQTVGWSRIERKRCRDRFCKVCFQVWGPDVLK